MNVFIASNHVRPPVLRAQGKNKGLYEKNKDGSATKKKVWLPPWVGASSGGGGQQGRSF